VVLVFRLFPSNHFFEYFSPLRRLHETQMLVSVIIATYNRSKTIERAVNSVLAQSWKAIEVIVVDDGSTDGTAHLLAKYGNKIRVISQRNQGAGAARNTGIKAASGEIISFLDSDDSWLPEKAERQVKLLLRTESSGVKCCICNATMLFGTGMVSSFTTAGLHPKQREGVWTNPAEVLTMNFLFFNQVVAVRREVLEQSGYFREDLRIMEDYDLALRLSLIGPWAFIADPLVVWHEDAGSGLSRNLSQLEICRHTFQILNDLSNSVPFGPLLPSAPLRHRRRLLKRKINALVLSSQSGHIRAASGRIMLLYLRVYEAIYRRLPFTLRMITRAI
jgi:glycosyltransferase involved in cell wall biosynthesis